MPDCRCLYYARKFKSFPYISAKTEIIKADFICPMCLHIKKRFCSHKKYYGYRHFGCDYCNNYVREYSPTGILAREFFFVLDYCVMMHVDQVIIEKESHGIIALPFFIFETKEQLIRKIQSYTTLS